MRIRLSVLVVAFLLSSTCAWSQTYRWVDGQGGVHYTEGLASVPEAYRSKARVIATPPAPPPPAPAAPTPAEPRVTPPPPPERPASSEPPSRSGSPEPSAPQTGRPTSPPAVTERYRATTSNAPRAVRVTYPPVQIKPPLEITDYPDAVSLTLFAIQRAAGLTPVPAVEVVIFPNPQMLEAGLVELRRSQMIAHDLAQFAAAVATGPDRILINEAAMVGRTRAWMFELLAHELTHTVQAANGWVRIDAWLNEGFADWVAYRVVHWLGVANYATLRERARLSLARGGSRSLPRLAELGRVGEWVVRTNSAGGAATYSQSFLAVEYLIQEKGLETVINYFNASVTSMDPPGTFRQIFGEDFEKFEARFASHLRALLP